MSDTLDIIINDARWASENPILALKRKPAPGALHVLTVGEVVPARLFFYDGPQGAASLSSVRKNGVTIGLFGKLVRKDGETLLFGTTVFTELQDARGDYGYAGSLDLLTDELKNAFNQGFDGTAFVDIKINGVRTHQFKLPIRPRTYAGTELDTHPAAEGLLAEMQAAAAEADADAAAANAAKVAAEGFRDEAQGFRNEAEGFKNDSEAARDESVAAKDISVAKAGEAATSATSAASSATTASTKAAEASDSADAAAASAASITFASNSEAIAGTLTTKVISPATLETKFANDLRTGMPGGMNFTGAASAAQTAFIPGATDFSAVWVINPSGVATSTICDAVNGFNLTVTTDGALVLFDTVGESTIVATANGAVPFNVWSWVSVVRSAGVCELLLNGISVGSAANTSDFSDPLQVGSNTTGNLPFAGVLHGHRYANFAMTADEVLGASRNEAVGRLVQKGGISLTSGSLVVGYSYRITSVAGGASFTVVGASSDAVGIEFVATGTTPTWGSGSLVTLGTVANYAPENCTSLNRWLDNVGGYHLTSVGGATALNPQPVRERSASWVFNYATGSFVGVDASVLSAVHVGPGEVRLTVAAWIPIENILGHGASTFIDAGTTPPWYNTYSQCSLIGPINGLRMATVYMQKGAPGSSLNTLMDAPAQGAIRYLE